MSNTVKEELTKDIQKRMLNTLKEKAIYPTGCTEEQINLCNYIVEKSVNCYAREKDDEEQIYDKNGRKMFKYIILFHEGDRKYSLFGFSYTLDGIAEAAQAENKNVKDFIVYRLASDANLLDTEDVAWKTEAAKDGFGQEHKEKTDGKE